MKSPSSPLARMNIRFAKGKWSEELGKHHLQLLKTLTENYGFSVSLGDLLLLEGNWYVTHAGLLRLATRSHCVGIQVQQVRGCCDPTASRWVFRALVYTNSESKGFVGYGDADPSNVSSVVRGAEMRVAETRAVNRALRKAYGIGLCSVEELGAFSSLSKSTLVPAPSNRANGSHGSNGSGNGQARLRDQLWLLIRRYNLNSNLVKAYAADYCGTETLSGASRELVDSFISHLASAAKENRDALVCKLNSYAQSVEALSR